MHKPFADMPFLHLEALVLGFDTPTGELEEYVALIKGHLEAYPAYSDHYSLHTYFWACSELTRREQLQPSPRSDFVAADLDDFEF